MYIYVYKLYIYTHTETISKVGIQNNWNSHALIIMLQVPQRKCFVFLFYITEYIILFHYYHNKLPKTQCLKTKQIYYLTGFQVRIQGQFSQFLCSSFTRLKSRCQPDRLLSEISGRNLLIQVIVRIQFPRSSFLAYCQLGLPLPLETYLWFLHMGPYFWKPAAVYQILLRLRSR